MSLLLFSDAHLDAVTAGMRRIDDLAGAFVRVGDLAGRHKVELAIFLGDLADPDSGSILIRVLDEAVALATRLADKDIPSIWIAGNHDTIEDGSGLTTLHPLRWLPKTMVIEKPTALDVGGMKMRLLPYPSRATQYDPEMFLREAPFFGNEPRLVLGHCTGIDGVQLGSETYDFARGSTLPFPIEECKRQGVMFMANGHFHKQQVTDRGIHIPGSLERLRFDEETNQPGVLIVDV